MLLPPSGQQRLPVATHLAEPQLQETAPPRVSATIRHRQRGTALPLPRLLWAPFLSAAPLGGWVGNGESRQATRTLLLRPLKGLNGRKAESCSPKPQQAGPGRSKWDGA